MLDSSQKQILTLLAKEWDIKGPPGILDIKDVVSITSLAPSDTMESIRELFSLGLVDMNELRTSIYLTPEGYDSITGDKGE